MQTTNRVIFFWMIGLWLGSAKALEDTCSDLKYLLCHEDADCKEKNGVFSKCVCKGSLQGDGLKGPDNSGCGLPKCSFDQDCGPNAICNDYFVCMCIPGFTGDPNMQCIDENECANKPCHPQATCQNTYGGFECTCNMKDGYKGDGFTCTHTCSMDYDCARNEKCIADVCVCKEGFELFEYVCTDINECDDNPCDENAICNNTNGGYTCTCKNGYAGNGEVCKAIPRNCHDIILDNPNANSDLYEIDPDGEGPMEIITVECEMRPGLGITIIQLLEPEKIRLTNRKPTRVYTYEQELPFIKAIIGTSDFCYQEMSYKARFGAVLLDGDNYWLNGNGNMEKNWGGAKEAGYCACGELGFCENRTSTCNADGTTEPVADTGKVIDKDRLPVLKVRAKPGQGYGEVYIGPVMCSPKPFDIPIDCHDARFNDYYKIKNDGPQVLDFDGPDGPLPPVLAHCDMTTYRHVGITVIPHKSVDYVIPDQPGSYSLEYNINGGHLDKLVEISHFCQQEAEYECTNSRLLNNGDEQGFFADTRGDKKKYWPGGMGVNNKCGCGLTKTCASENFGCNCDVKDGVTRKDFGKVIDKADLPIGDITLNEIGGSSTGKYKVGPLMCSQREFGIPATCKDYVEEGYTDSYTYLIDPDGPEVSGEGELPPFSVYCRFEGDPLYAVTVVYHQWEEEFTFINEMKSFHYIRVSVAQLEALVTRSVSCTQSVKFTCTNAPLHVDGESRVEWTSSDGTQYTYFAGDGSKSAACTCGQSSPSSCADGLQCNCDAAGGNARVDVGLITTKQQLPIMNISSSDYSSGEELLLGVGPLECQELFPNCADLKVFNDRNRFASENKLENGEYVIDPDGPEGVAPFVVTCNAGETILPVDSEPTDPTEGDPDNPDQGVDKCYEFKYKSPTTGKPVTPEQVQALVENSRYCTQSLTQQCLNAPLTDHTTFYTCDGQEQTGWAGSRGDDMCACGVTGTCVGGSADKCNCDFENGTMSADTGNIVDKDRLAVCKVCVSLDPLSDLPAEMDPKIRRVKPTVSSLVCAMNPVGRGKSCQNWRDKGMISSGPLMMDVDDKGPLEPFPVQCVLHVYPPAGWTEIHPKEPEIVVPPEGVDAIIEYYVYEMQFIETLIQTSGYCTQELWLECEGSSFSLSGQYGWYSRDGKRQAYWAGNEEGTTGCAGPDGACQCDVSGTGIDGGLIVDDSLLPVKRVVLGPASGYRKLKVGPVKCFDLYRDCEEIRRNRAKTNPLGNHTYAIDPDRGGGVEPFAVVCDFKTVKNIGITVVPVIKEDVRVVRRQRPPKWLVVPVYYDSVSYDQIHALATISGYCHQGMQYVCYNSPLTNVENPDVGYYNKYGGGRSTSYGVASDSSVRGCACMALNTCPADQKCHCDEMGKMTVDYGNEIDRDALPVIRLEFGGQYKRDASAGYDITDVRCGPKPFDLPRDCQEVYERGLRSGEHLIYPSTRVEPYLVYCDMEILEKGGVTIIGHDREIRTTVTYDSSVEVTYYNVELPGIKALTEISAYCFQSFKYECRKTKLLSKQGFFYWYGGMGSEKTYSIGTSPWFSRQCNCGRDGYCGGSEDKDTLVSLLRPCNCDAADDEDRADAGVFNSTSRLPIVEFTFENTGIAGAFGAVTVGKLYCAKQDFDLDECKMGFHDCHMNAKCKNTHGSYECQCKKGWEGYGREGVWANGRNCYDDDECAMNYCPWSATCINLPGSFECVCKEGFTQTGKRRCQDIDECALGTHNCHENARCINVDGGFECRCNRNFRGNGTSCEPLALCACFGDPHCITSDGVLIDYQGQCQYVMSRDKCDDLSSIPTYEVRTTFKPREDDRRTDVSWVKSVTFKIYNYTIELMQGNEVRVNGYRVVYFREDRVRIQRVGKNVEVHTDIGVELSWDGDEVIELYTPGQYGGTTCGLCGNYNGDPDDDLMIGPQCEEQAGQLTESFSYFGDSWLVPEYLNEFPECFANCSGPEEPGLCEGIDLSRAELVCNKVYSMSGIFQECLLDMDTEDLEMLKRSCIYDACYADDIENDVCEAAAFLVSICRKQYGVIITEFRSEEFCKVTCGENMVYDLCGYGSQTTCFDVVTGETPMGYSSTCEEGCFCKEGYVLDGESCVLPKDCGCFYQGQYYQVGDVVIRGDCTEMATCKEDGTMKKDPIECHQDAVCELKDGFFGCHCEEGYYGDGVEKCLVDPCLEDPCGENEICYRNETVSDGYVCKCAMGFIGDCGNCTEIDECKTATHDCPANSYCVNTVGSYKCPCRDGYFNEYSGRCTDIDECELAKLSDTPICGNNSRCTNKIGTYECPCCSGHERNDNGECVESTSPIPESEEGPQCCICNTAICDRPGKVCGEDGVEYDSIRDMIISNCEKGLPRMKQLNVDYYGGCKGSCKKVTCPKYQTCGMGPNGKPTCECEECTTEEIEITEPVCTDKLDIYPDYCTFKKVQCQFDAEAEPLDSMIPCEGKGQGKPVGPWSEWSECSVTCGKGVSTKTREQRVAEMTPKQKEKYPLTLETECYQPACPDDLCDVEKPCPKVHAECYVNEAGEKICECPSCENQFDPVCGYLVGTYEGVSEGSYKSACHLQKLACNQNLEDYEVMHKGPCGVEPLNCTRVPYSDYVVDENDTGYVSEEKVNLFDCDGGCGRYKKFCCQPDPSQTEELTVTLKKGDLTKQKTVRVIKACVCVDTTK